MKSVKLDPATLAKLYDLKHLLEVRDESGRVLGYFSPASDPQKAYPRSPYSDEEIEQFRQQRKGRPLSEILKQLEQS